MFLLFYVILQIDLNSLKVHSLEFIQAFSKLYYSHYCPHPKVNSNFAQNSK